MNNCNRCYKEIKLGDKVKIICTDCFSKIADLEAKLAESEKKHLLDETEWQDYCAYKIIEPQIKGCLDREREYKQQLAEKDKEIVIIEKALECACRDLQSSDGAYINAIEVVQGNEVILPVQNTMQIVYEIALSELGIIKNENMPDKYQSNQSKKILKQDKISFAVEQLEKVKEILLENLYDLYSKPSEIWDEYGDLYDVAVEDAVNGTIDNQIKQLIHQQEDKGE